MKWTKYFSFLFLAVIFTSILSAQHIRNAISFAEAPFYHGVASGDPTPNNVMIWTKVTPPAGNINNVEVYWQVATDTAFQNVVNFGKINTTDTQDFTVKVDVCGLQPNTYYYYVFKALNKNSIIGRTKTAPFHNIGGQAKYAIASCSNYEHGFFNAYQSMAERNDLDAVIHLGDYYYEYKSGGFSSTVVTSNWGRVVSPTHEAINLTDYRARHSHYKLDNQLQMVHQLYPFITTWDDHETANDSYKDGAQNHDPATEGSWINRKVGSFQAYNEWMPIRPNLQANNGKIWRKLRYGNLLDLIILDTRLWARDVQDMSQTNNPNRNLLGADQFQWLENELADTTTKWKIICNQMMFAPLKIFGLPVNADQWDGYNKDRQRLINYIESNQINNVIILTGDIHTSWVNNIEGSNNNNVASEFVVTSVTSPGLDVIEVALGQLPQSLLNTFGNSIPNIMKFFNPHMKYVNIEDHGYMVFTVDSNKAQGDYVFIEREDTIYNEDYASSWYANAYNPTMQQATTPMPNGQNPIKPPVVPIHNLSFALLQDTLYVNGTENTTINECLVNVLTHCPTLSVNTISQPTFGTLNLNNFCFEYNAITNYYGNDMFSIAVCNNLSNQCDTIIVQLNIAGQNSIDSFTYLFPNDSTLSVCVSFDDLTTDMQQISFQGAMSGQFSYTPLNGNTICFQYNAQNNFVGQDQIQLIACDSNAICDTIIAHLLISGNANTQIVHLYGNDHQLLSNCLHYDDLQGNIINTSLQYNQNNSNALIYNDTCISYQSNIGFSGVDTLLAIACDDFTPQLCDTIMYIMHINEDTSGNPGGSTSIQETIENDQFAVLGIYPNPFDIEIIIQYYQFVQGDMYLKLFDAQGKIFFNQTISTNSKDLQYARLETTTLGRGTYFIQVSNEKFTYTKKLVK